MAITLGPEFEAALNVLARRLVGDLDTLPITARADRCIVTSLTESEACFLTFHVALFYHMATFGPGVVVVEPASVEATRRPRRCSRRGRHHAFRGSTPQQPAPPLNSVVGGGGELMGQVHVVSVRVEA